MIFRGLKGSWGKALGSDLQPFGGVEKTGIFASREDRLNVKLSQQWNQLGPSGCSHAM